MSYPYYQQNASASPDTQQLRLPAHMQWPASQTQPSQLPPPGPSPTPWNQQAHQAPQISEHIPQTSHSQAIQPNQTQMMTMMAMWQQMQQMQQLQAQQQQQQQQSFMPPYGVPQPQHQATDHSQPFASHDRYDQDLAHVLFQSKLRGQDYKTAIETLHMYRGHHADAWKNYFLLNFHRIDGLVTTLHARHAQTVHSNGASNGRTVGTNGITPSPMATPPIRYKGQVPRPRSVPNDAQQNQKVNENPIAKRDHSSNIASSSRPAVRSSASSASHPRQSPPSVLPTTSRRQTLNSLSAPLMMNPIPEQVLIDKATGLPRAPSRSPSPPPADAVRKPRGTGTQYIPEDEVYFFRFITWELKRRPELKKSELCELLEEKVPAHSAYSWSTFWRNHEDVADKILFNAQLHESDQPAVLGSISSASPRRARQRAEQRAKKSKHRSESVTDSDEDSESSSEPEDDEDSDYGGRRGSRQRARRASSSGSSSEELDDENDELSSNNLLSSDDGEELGEAGTAFGMPELRAVAKYISSLPDWKYMKGKEKWEPFTEKYPQRTSASWKEYYRRKEKEIDQLARKYTKRADRRAAVKLQRGRPSWASGNQTSSEAHGAKKRGHSDEEVDRDEKKMRIAEIRRS
ncbi:hypothetical protein BD410DRAFT_781111 [Rickenella mellea]|uniref:Uncharacterized protein n=1 Tax=Rickenella mellea TaxID=50990 RepID=A0A4Y7QP05_9AGAM|nr:hypothetical protein BD410DRAFT_781111 [Rickenella mellea]